MTMGRGESRHAREAGDVWEEEKRDATKTFPTRATLGEGSAVSIWVNAVAEADRLLHPCIAPLTIFDDHKVHVLRHLVYQTRLGEARC